MTPSEFDAAVAEIRSNGIAPKATRRRKIDCTPEQWAANREYMSLWHRQPENKKKHDRSRARHACNVDERNGLPRISAVDVALLTALAASVSVGVPATASDLLDIAADDAPELAAKWSPRAVASRLGRYGIKSRKTNGRKVYDSIPQSCKELLGL